MINKINITLCLLIVSCTSILAQQDLGTNFLYNTWQVNYTNPALMPEGMKFAIALPGAYGNLSSPLAINDVITPTETGNLLDIEKAVSQLNNRNSINSNAHIHSFDIAFVIKNMGFSFGHALRNDFKIGFPKELVELAWNGNANYIGSSLQIAPTLALNSFNQYSFGMNYKMGKLTLGGKLKLLSGIATINSKKTDVTLATNSDVYQLDFGGDYTIRTAGFMEFDAEQGIVINDAQLQENLILSENLGLGFDIGATLQLSDKLTVGASILDIGAIRWKTLPNVYTAEGNAQFDGVDVLSYSQDFTLSFDEKKDSILALFNVAQSEESFSSSLPTRIYAHATYELNKKLTLGGLFYTEDYQRNINAAFALNATFHLGRILDIGASYAIKPNSAANIGLSSVLNLGPLQFYAMTDNIISVIAPESQRNINFRTGLNLIFRSRKEKKSASSVSLKNESYYKDAPPVECANGKKKRRK